MRASIHCLAILALLFVSAGVAGADGFSVGNVRPPAHAKPAGSLPPPPEVPRVQGDTVGDPFVIGGVPFSTSGSTCGFNNDYDAVCPYTGSTSPDVVFRWTADGSASGLNIDLCASIYDTKVYVYEDAVGNLIACNDDFCSWQSYLHNVPVVTGRNYFIVVDGYGGSCGDYYLNVDPWIDSCAVNCPDYAIPEGEPDCYDGYADTYNGGCNVAPFPVFQGLEPSCDPIAVCGTTGVYVFGSLLYRDTDWFEIDLPAAAEICLSGDAEVPCYFFIIDGRSGCAGLVIVAFADVFCGLMTGLCWLCDAGTWWMWAGPSSWDPQFACGSLYWMEISGYDGGATPARETTWGGIKSLFN